MTDTPQYVGRFAPSPTGPLHYGSLIAALASWLDARHHQGRWLLRIEDLDPPREDPASPTVIMRQLEALGLWWDGEVLFQSSRDDAYREALAALAATGQVFACRCTRKQVGPVYPGTCRDRAIPLDSDDIAIRFRVPDNRTISLTDPVAGQHHWHSNREVGDFIVRRRDGLFAYQLAVVVDDDYQKVTHVIRGSDLLDSTPRQLFLLEALNLPAPDYVHIPVLLGADGAKLSKQAHAQPVDTTNTEQVLRYALMVLKQPEPPGVASIEDLLSFASANWNIRLLPRQMSVPWAANPWF
ncbi:MAG: tRNA glutamyl-Q(34) synthetase GluQRS [Pseudomonadales bacterium]|nr:tRNA glutamyl-Q(34) synthetase GluQRS [Pseudomonadales bacterium]